MLVRVTPDVRGDTHEKISTGQADSKFGFSMADAGEAIARAQASPHLNLLGAHAHIGSQLLESRPVPQGDPADGGARQLPGADLGGGLGVQYTDDQREPPSIEDYVGTIVRTTREAGIPPDARLLIEPGRSLTANSCVTLYTVESVKQNVSRWVAVDGGMSDNLRPMLYGAATRPMWPTASAAAPMCAGRQALRVRRRDRPLGADGRPAPRRRDRDAGDRRLRLRDGEQLQRCAKAAGHLLRGRQRPRGLRRESLEDLTARDVR